jgi:hypothetical protein
VKERFAMPSRNDRNIVVFLLWPSLAYGARMALSLGLIILGFALQILMLHLLPGIVIVLAGNLFLLVRGYDNRVQVGRFDPAAEWEEVAASRLDEIQELNQRIKKWDRSAFDISNGVGGCLFAVLGIGLFMLLSLGADPGKRPFLFCAVNAAVLLLPHWFSGIRTILTTPKLLVKIATIKAVLERAEEQLKGVTIRYYVQLKGKKTKLPADVKLRIDLPGKPPEFLGLYGQVVTNDVQGHSYPYFYTVLVARKGFGLKKLHRDYTPPDGIVAECSLQGDVEVFVIRQHTTKTSGYHTKVGRAVEILDQGLALSRAAIMRKA